MEWQVREVLKRDSFGRVERLGNARGEELVRRVACGASIPGSGVVARILLRRERRALERLARLEGVPQLVALPQAGGRNDTLEREWIEGQPLHRAHALAHDFFDHLDALVDALHARGVCHNDLHKEQNILVGADGFPHLIDFQLASCHESNERRFRTRARDDLRHVQKHRRRYTRDGRGPQIAGVEHGRGLGLKRSLLARIWRRSGKPIYNFVTRRVLRTSDGEARRPSSGPWPEWSAARGPRGGSTRSTCSADS